MVPLWNRQAPAAGIRITDQALEVVTHTRFMHRPSDPCLASRLQMESDAAPRERDGRPDNTARFHAGASAPRSRSSLHGIFGIAPFRTTYEPRGEPRDPYSGGSKRKFRPPVLLPRASNGCGPRCRSGSVKRGRPQALRADVTEGGCLRWHPPPAFFLARTFSRGSYLATTNLVVSVSPPRWTRAQ